MIDSILIILGVIVGRVLISILCYIIELDKKIEMEEQIEKELLDAMKSIDQAMRLIMRLPGDNELNEHNAGILEVQKKNIKKVLQEDYDKCARRRKNRV